MARTSIEGISLAELIARARADVSDLGACLLSDCLRDHVLDGSGLVPSPSTNESTVERTFLLPWVASKEAEISELQASVHTAREEEALLQKNCEALQARAAALDDDHRKSWDRVAQLERQTNLLQQATQLLSADDARITSLLTQLKEKRPTMGESTQGAAEDTKGQLRQIEEQIESAKRTHSTECLALQTQIDEMRARMEGHAVPSPSQFTDSRAGGENTGPLAYNESVAERSPASTSSRSRGATSHKETPSPLRRSSRYHPYPSTPRLVTDTIRTAFGVQYYNRVKELEGVSKERLALFESDPDAFGPDVRNLRLDTRFSFSTDLMKAMPWNICAQDLFVGVVSERVAEDNGDGRYGSLEDSSVIATKVKNRFDRLYREISETAPRGNESWEEVATRVEDKELQYNKRARERRARDHKLTWRVQVSSIMRQVAESNSSDAGIKRWSYALRSLNKLGCGGMSDEESDEEEVIYPGNAVSMRPCRKVLELKWRHPSFKDLFDEIDGTPKEYPDLFNGRIMQNRIRRVRVSKASKRKPPRNLNVDFFNPAYLENIGRVGMIARGIDEEPYEMEDDGNLGKEDLTRETDMDEDEDEEEYDGDEDE
ncbi:hypothetical protein GGF50DRAFT_93046 [Schizophyllum commune]